MMLVRVVLTSDEMGLGDFVGRSRCMINKEHGCVHRDGYKPTLRQNIRDDILGATGELAAGIALGRPWYGEYKKPGGPDLTDDWTYVRAISNPKHCLICRERDPLDCMLVLARAEQWDNLRVWWIGGCLPVPLARERGPFEERGRKGFPCWWVERERLQPLEWYYLQCVKPVSTVRVTSPVLQAALVGPTLVEPKNLFPPR